MTDTTDAAPAWPRNPWLSMWVRPRGTLRRILDADPHRRVLLLAVLAGISEALSRAEGRSLGDALSLSALLPLAALAGAIGGVVGIFFWGWLIGLTGRWIGGQARAFQLRCAVAWGAVPLVWGLLLYAIELPLFGHEMFEGDMVRIESDPGLLLSYLGIKIVQVVIGVWSAVLIVRGVAEAQGFRSSWKGLGNVLLAGLILLACISAVVIPIAVIIRIA